MSVRLKDIAERANVSISTVSRVINNDKSKPAKKETADRIWQIVNELGYVPNLEARNLIKGETGEDVKVNHKTIGCINTSSKDAYHDPFFSHLAEGIKEELDRRDYVITYSLSAYGMNFSTIYNYLVSHPVDGIILMGRLNKEIFDYLKANYENIVYTGVNYVDKGIDEVICNGYDGFARITEYLIENGHKNFGFIGDSASLVKKDTIINERRFEAFLDTLKKHSIAIDEKHIINIEPFTPTAYNAMKEYLTTVNKEELPSALCCMNDVTAIGAMKALNEAGYRIPEDISIVGFDDIEMVSYINPSLSTVQVPKQELGRMAVKLLVDKIENEREYPVRMDIPFELLIRESTKNLK